LSEGGGLVRRFRVGMMRRNTNIYDWVIPRNGDGCEVWVDAYDNACLPLSTRCRHLYAELTRLFA
jgi:hypothetical protein